MKRFRFNFLCKYFQLSTAECSRPEPVLPLHLPGPFMITSKRLPIFCCRTSHIQIESLEAAGFNTSIHSLWDAINRSSQLKHHFGILNKKWCAECSTFSSLSYCWQIKVVSKNTERVFCWFNKFLSVLLM